MDVNTNKNAEKSTFDWSILLIVSLAPIIIGSYRDGFAALFPFLQRDFNLTRAQLGLHSTLFFSTSAFISIFSGRLVDLKGPKWGLIIGTSFIGIFLILHSISPNFIILLLFAGFTGFAVSIINPASNKGIIDWFPLKWRSTALGILSTAFPIGGMLGSIILPFLGVQFGWRKTILFPGIMALLCSLFILRYYQNERKTVDSLKKNVKSGILFWKSFNKLIKNRDLISVSSLGFFFGAMAGSIAAHYTLFLYLDYGLSEKIAGLGLAAVQSGSILGRPGWGFICDRFLDSNKRKTFLYIGLLFTFLSLILGFFLKDFKPTVGVLFILAFFVGSAGRGWQGLYYAAVAETVNEEETGIAMGFSLLFMRSGIMLSPPIFGYIADLREAYDYSWLLLALIIFLASIVQYLFYIKFQK